MPWVKLTDDWYDDRKIKAAGPVGIAMWTVGLSWCARNLTDGFIPYEQVDCLLSWRGVAWQMWMGDLFGGGEDVEADKVAALLVKVDLWEDTPGGFRVRNYLKYQPSAEQVLADREKERKRWQERKSSRSEQTPGGVPPESEQTPTYPVPVPESRPRTKTPPSSSSVLQGAARPEDEELIEAALSLYGERMLARQPDGSVHTPGPWKRKTIENARKELIPQVVEWVKTYDVTSSQLADAMVDGQVPVSWKFDRRPA